MKYICPKLCQCLVNTCKYTVNKLLSHGETINPSIPVSVHCIDLELFTCWWPQCNVWSWMHLRVLKTSNPLSLTVVGMSNPSITEAWIWNNKTTMDTEIFYKLEKILHCLWPLERVNKYGYNCKYSKYISNSRTEEIWLRYLESWSFDRI